MKLLLLFTTIFICIIQNVIAGDVFFPNKGGNLYLNHRQYSLFMWTYSDYIKLERCRYNTDRNRIYCNFNDYKESYILTIPNTSSKPNCNMSSGIKEVQLYDKNKRATNVVSETSINEVIEDGDTYKPETGKGYFEILMNNNCKFTFTYEKTYPNFYEYIN